MHVPCPQWSYHRFNICLQRWISPPVIPNLIPPSWKAQSRERWASERMLCAAVFDINTHFLPCSIIFPSKTEKHSTLVVSLARWGLRIWNLADMIMTPWQPGELRWSVMAALELITTFWTFSLQHVHAESPSSRSLSWFPGIGFNCVGVRCQVSLVEHLWNLQSLQRIWQCNVMRHSVAMVHREKLLYCTLLNKGCYLPAEFRGRVVIFLSNFSLFHSFCCSAKFETWLRWQRKKCPIFRNTYRESHFLFFLSEIIATFCPWNELKTLLCGDVNV